MNRSSKALARKYRTIGLCFLLPAIAVYLLFMAYPLAQTLYLSFTSWSGFGPKKLIGIGNYANMLRDSTLTRALGNTVYLAVISSLLSVAMGILMAWMNLFLRRMEGQVTRTVLFAPNMISPTITGLMFLFVFTEDIGLLNNILSALGLGGMRLAWLANVKTVLPVIVFVTVWRQAGLPMILIYAGFQGIPTELIESARLDGASDVGIFRRILLPLVKPQIELATMFTMLGGLRIYDSVVSLTGGGPARQSIVMPMWIVENAFTYTKFGYASALAVLFIAVVFVFRAVLSCAFRGETYEL